MTVGQEGLTSAAAPERYVGQLPGFHTAKEKGEPERRTAPLEAPATVGLSLEGLTEPVFPPASWLDPAPGSVLVDHPLLRGLLLELPPKGDPPSPEWLNRWFEAARSILELIYVPQR